MLRRIGMFRREAQPTPDVLNELFVRSAPRLICSQCHESGLEVRSASEDVCGETLVAAPDAELSIPWERLELFPDTELCTACQQKTEQAGGSVAGVLPEMRQRHGPETGTRPRRDALSPDLPPVPALGCVRAQPRRSNPCRRISVACYGCCLPRSQRPVAVRRCRSLRRSRNKSARAKQRDSRRQPAGHG